jgi:hypothetical protein
MSSSSSYQAVASNCPSFTSLSSSSYSNSSSSSSSPSSSCDCRNCEHLHSGKCEKDLFDSILSNLSDKGRNS